MESYIYKKLATCLSTTKIIGENIILTTNITEGTSPFTVTYKKDGTPLETQTQPTIGTYSYTYPQFQVMKELTYLALK